MKLKGLYLAIFGNNTNMVFMPYIRYLHWCILLYCAFFLCSGKNYAQLPLYFQTPC